MIDQRPLRELLKEELLRRKEKTKGYSLRAFARDLGVSPATLSQVLSAKRKIGEGFEEKIRTFLIEGATPLRLDDTIVNKIDLSLLENLPSWHYFAALELLKIPNFPFTSSAIAKSLDIEEATAEMIVKKLLENNLITKTTTGWIDNLQDASTVFDKHFDSNFRKSFLKGLAKKSLDSIDRDPEERTHFFLILPFHRKKTRAFDNLIHQFQRKIWSLIKKDEFDSVYALQVSLVPLTQPEK